MRFDPISVDDPRGPQGEDAQIFRWYAETALELGFNAEHAALIALRRIDLHALTDLIDKGCPPETALEILR